MAQAFRRIAALAGTCLAIAALTPSRAVAHTTLERSRPAKDAHLAEAPRELRLRFSGPIEMIFTRLRLIGPDSVEVTLGDFRLDSARTVVAPIQGPLTPGTYTVIWQIAAADGHPIRGRYSFTIAPGATGLTVGDRAGEPDTPTVAPAPGGHHDPTSMPTGEGFDAESPLYIAVRWVTFATLLGILGAVAFRFVVLGLLNRRAGEDGQHIIHELASARAATVGLTAAGVLGVAALARLVAQSYAMHGPDESLSSSMILAMVSRTIWGWGWLLQVAAVVIAVIGFALARSSRRGGWPLAGLAAIALAFTPGLSGHAASSPRLTSAAVIADGLHVIGAGGWLGSLLVVLVAGIPAAVSLGEAKRGAAVADVVNAFSPTALLFAGVAAATGVFSAWLHVGAWGSLWQSEYGRLLLIKLIVLSIVAGTGAFNWRRVRPRLGDDLGTKRIRRSATVEVVVAAVVLLVTAILVATPPPMDAASMGP